MVDQRVAVAVAVVLVKVQELAAPVVQVVAVSVACIRTESCHELV